MHHRQKKSSFVLNFNPTKSQWNKLYGNRKWQKPKAFHQTSYNGFPRSSFTSRKKARINLKMGRFFCDLREASRFPARSWKASWSLLFGEPSVKRSPAHLVDRAEDQPRCTADKVALRCKCPRTPRSHCLSPWRQNQFWEIRRKQCISASMFELRLKHLSSFGILLGQELCHWSQPSHHQRSRQCVQATAIRTSRDWSSVLGCLGICCKKSLCSTSTLLFHSELLRLSSSWPRPSAPDCLSSLTRYCLTAASSNKIVHPGQGLHHGRQIRPCWQRQPGASHLMARVATALMSSERVTW